MKVIIVGGVAGGASAAARLRRLDEDAEIIVYERSGYVSYANCGLPYYIGGTITDRDDLELQDAEGFWERFRVKVNVRHEVTAIDTTAKTVTVRDIDGDRQFTDTYDKLLLAPGARPAKPGIPGVDGDRIFTLRTVEDTYKLKDFIDAEAPKSAVVVGGGYIGLEMAENLTHQGIKVTIVEFLDQVMAPLDYDMACQAQGVLRRNGVELRLATGVTGFAAKDSGVEVSLTDGGSVACDMVMLCAGVAPDTTLAKTAGLELGVKGAIKVDEHMETSAKDVYAAGDAVETEHFVTGVRGLIALAGPANKQGRIAADNMCGIESVYKPAQGTSVAKLFDATIAVTGANEKACKAAGIDYEKIVTTSSSHASYYPGAKSLVTKVIFEKKTGKLLGAEIVGYDGADKRIDVLATAIRAGLTAFDLTGLDLAYAPPYGSAKDPVIMTGFVMENVLLGKVKQFHWHDVASLPRDGSVTLLDVRTVREYEAGHIDGTVNIPVDELRERINELEKGKTVYVNCQSGLRSYIACRILSQKGFDCYNLSGGYSFYSSVMKERAIPSEGLLPCGAESK